MTDTAITTTRWKSLERWSAWAFLGAGGLVLVAAILALIDMVTAMSTQGPLRGVPFYVGLILSYIGLLGLYPRLADETPGLAKVGVVLVALPILMVSVILVWGVLGYSLSAVPLPITVIPSFGLLFVAILLLLVLGITVFGIASLRTPAVPRTVAGALLVLAATWVTLFGASAVYGTQFPDWVNFISNGVVAMALLAIGYVLQTEAEPIDREEPSPTEVRHG